MRKKKFFSWRTAPRSIQVLIEWLPVFNMFQGESWDKKVNGEFELRRKIRWIYESNKDNPDLEVVNNNLEDFASGSQIGNKDKESLVRQQFTTAEQFGFLGTTGEENLLYITEAGKRIIEGKFTPEDFLVQLIKMYVITNDDEDGIFPLEIFINLLNEFKYLSRYELTFMFGVTTPSKFINATNAIEEFRNKYTDRKYIPNKKDNKKVEKLLVEAWNNNFGGNTFLKSWSDYTDAFIRSVLYTDMFETSGIGHYTKIKIKNIFEAKFNLLLSDKFTFEKPPAIKESGDIIVDVSSRNNLEWFGKVGNIKLPWDNFKERQKLVQETLKRFNKEYDSKEIENEIITLSKTINKTKSIEVLKDIEGTLSKKLMDKNINEYINIHSKNIKSKKEIITRFHTILNDNDMSALWLEVNTWKSLVSLNGNHIVVPNFKMEADLTPRSFAPGIGNTPDMELYNDDYIIIPEVSLMTGKVQWEHEGSSVIDHVIDKAKQYSTKNTMGLFISSSINYRTFWQFFILSKTSWLGTPIPVIPLTIKQYIQIIEHLYKNEETIDTFYKFLIDCASNALSVNDYEEWKKSIEDNIIKLCA